MAGVQNFGIEIMRGLVDALKVIVMDSQKRKALAAAGWRFGDAADFLNMTDEERQLSMPG